MNVVEIPDDTRIVCEYERRDGFMNAVRYRCLSEAAYTVEGEHLCGHHAGKKLIAHYLHESKGDAQT